VIPVVQRNRRGKPVLSFGLKFSAAMDLTSATNTNNYQLEWVSTKRVKKKVQTTLHPVAITSATYRASTDSIRLSTTATKTTFAKGGQLTIIGSPPSGVESAAGVFAATRVYIVSPQASRIEL
jgi:hypothetical protein